MEPVMVTVKRAGDVGVYDLEVTADMPVGQLAEGVAQALGWNLGTDGRLMAYDVEAHPPGRKLHPDETLAQALAWDGTLLVFHPQTVAPPPMPSETYIMRRVD